MAARKKSAAAPSAAEEKPKRKPRDPNAPPRVVQPMQERAFLPREKVEDALRARGFDPVDLYKELNSQGSSRTRPLPAPVLAAYARFRVHRSSGRFLEESGIARNRLALILGRCAMLDAEGRIPVSVPNNATYVEPEDGFAPEEGADEDSADDPLEEESEPAY